VTIRRPLAATVLSVVLAAGLGACGGGGKDKNTKVTIDTAGPGRKTDGATITLNGILTGAEEVPGPGVKDGIGSFVIDIAGAKGCYVLKATLGEKPLKAHIHSGVKGASGPVLVDLMPTFEPGESAFQAKSCVDLPPDTTAKLLANPAGFYVNVHTEGHPDGAMRGQLAKS
jgi:hypothetical protein